VVEKYSVDGAWVIIVQNNLLVPVRLVIDGIHCDLSIAAADTDLFQNRNAILAVRNGETVEQIITWLTYHATHHGVSGAVILDRATDAVCNAFAQDL
jgi:hypothetical protein